MWGRNTSNKRRLTAILFYYRFVSSFLCLLSMERWVSGLNHIPAKDANLN